MNIFEEILVAIQTCPRNSATKLVAIDGLGGSGKSTLTHEIVKLDSKIKILESDHFPCLPEEHPYHPAGAQTRVNLGRFQHEALIPLTQGRTAMYENTFWWSTDQKPHAYEIAPGEIVLVEGCYSFHSSLRDYYDYSIWVECSEEEALSRAIKRDGEDGAEIWKQVHAPNERNYAAKQKPMEHVDMIVINEKDGFHIVEKRNITQ